MSSDRTFTIHEVTTVHGCKTKKPHNSRYHSSTPESAAKKAHTVLCGRKNVKGTCTFIITMRETTQGSNRKLYTYKVSRHKLDEPVELSNGVVFDHKVVARKAKSKKKSKNCRHQSSGPMRRSKRRHHMTSSLLKEIGSDLDIGLQKISKKSRPKKSRPKKSRPKKPKHKKSRKSKTAGRPRKSCRNTRLKKSCVKRSHCSWRKGTGCVRKSHKRKSKSGHKKYKFSLMNMFRKNPTTVDMNNPTTVDYE